MKKILSILLVLVVLAGAGLAAWYFYFRPQPFYKAEDILPNSTIILVETPNADNARKHWDSTPLARIFAEKDVQDFLAAPRAAFKGQVSGKPGLDQFQFFADLIAKIVPHAHGQAFVSFQGMDVTPELKLRMIAGFDAGNEAKAAARAVEDAAAEVRAKYPKGAREEKKHEGVKYEVWSNGDAASICRARLGNFFLFASDETELRNAIELAKGKQASPLKNEELFKKASAKVEGPRDVFVYFNFTQVMAKLGPLMALAPGGGSQVRDMAALKAIAYSNRFDEKGMSTKLAALVPEKERPPVYQIAREWKKKSLPLVPAGTLLYGASCFDIGTYYDLLAKDIAAQPGAMQKLPMLGQIDEALKSQNIDLRKDVIGKLGEEFAVSLDWPDGEQFPKIVLLAETTDAPALMTALDTILKTFVPPTTAAANPALPAPTIDTVAVEGKTIHRAVLLPQQQLGFFYVDQGPFVALAFQESVLPALVTAQAKSPPPGFDQNATYKQLQSSLPRTTSQFLYIDNKPLFQKIYATVAPFAMLGAAMMPQQKAVDLSKLPKAEAISRHLGPSCGYQSFDADGFYHQSIGPFPPEAPFLAAGVAAGLAAPAISQAQKQMMGAGTPPVMPPAGGPPPGAMAPPPAEPQPPPTLSPPETEAPPHAQPDPTPGLPPETAPAPAPDADQPPPGP